MLGFKPTTFGTWVINTRPGLPPKTFYRVFLHREFYFLNLGANRGTICRARWGQDHRRWRLDIMKRRRCDVTTLRDSWRRSDVMKHRRCDTTTWRYEAWTLWRDDVTLWSIDVMKWRYDVVAEMSKKNVQDNNKKTSNLVCAQPVWPDDGIKSI